MWLIDTSTLKLVFKTDPSEVKYVILSHTWEDEEVFFQEIQNLILARPKKGFSKIDRVCRLAREKHGISYAWVDTCCIDKSSSADLSEAINSMFRYYELSTICFVYLSDLQSDASIGPDPDPKPPPSFSKCRWLTRGWTLQELIAPHNLKFYDESWSLRGSKDGWAGPLAEITGIQPGALSPKRQLDNYSVAARFSWAAKRETTRKEDLAYCMLGIFGVYMPLLYGESENAFLRLQEEISKSTNDISIFAWQAEPGDEQRFRGLFARSPAEFINCARVTREPSVSRYDKEYSITNKGLRFDHVLTALVEGADRSKRNRLSESGRLDRVRNAWIESIAVTSMDLECFSEDPGSSSIGKRNPTLGIYLTKLEGEYVRNWPSLLSAKHAQEQTVIRKDEEQPTIYAFKSLTKQQSNRMETQFYKQVVARLDFPRSWVRMSFRLWESKDTNEASSCFWLLNIDPVLSVDTHHAMECLVVCTLSVDPTTRTRKAKSHVFVRKEGKWEIGRLTLYKHEHQVFREKTALEQFQEYLWQEHDSHHYARHWDGKTHALVNISEPHFSSQDGKFHIEITVLYKKDGHGVGIIDLRSR
ncbi:HET-domain-containing protein [Apiospora rasikravindrae]|uniref:HET-domain-containing protein n=1 Tax=Apiospora rasikravindrae TaxID=990691 RepID=A0ABR1T865_9PEZI